MQGQKTTRADHEEMLNELDEIPHHRDQLQGEKLTNRRSKRSSSSGVAARDVSVATMTSSGVSTSVGGSQGTKMINGNGYYQPSLLTPLILCILATETGERFAYFGFRAILVLYFTHILQFEDSQAIALYSFTTCLAYFSPLLGSLLADGGLGRYKTILYFGLVYVGGLAILSLAAGTSTFTLGTQRTISFLGLFLVCLGTGGIKPCVSAFGADQASQAGDLGGIDGHEIDSRLLHDGVELSSSDSDDRLGDDNDYRVTDADHVVTNNNADSILLNLSSRRDHERAELVRRFFAYFYFCISLGALTGIGAVPIVKVIYGFGAAFVVPTIFMIAAMLLFVSKRNEYVHHIPGEGGSTLWGTFQVVVWLARHQLSLNALIAYYFPFVRPDGSPDCLSRLEQDRIFADLSDSNDDTSTSSLDESYSAVQEQLDDASRALHVLPILATLPVFWCLYDQQGSVWTLQANRMDLKLFRWTLQPEQMTLINPFLIMVFIPLFDRIICPVMQNRRWDIQPLRRMSWGMILTSISFFLNGLVESEMHHRESAGLAKSNVFWQLPQLVILTAGIVLKPYLVLLPNDLNDMSDRRSIVIDRASYRAHPISFARFS